MHRDTDPIIVFDTNCVLCSRVVGFILAHERDKLLRFAGAWSDAGRDLAARHGFSTADLDETFLLVTEAGALARSDAALAIAAHLRAPWRWLAVLHLLPKELRDGVYRLVARRRYRWFGRRENCTLVPAAERHRFIGAGDA